LNWAWIETFFKIEAYDIQHLEHPQDIINDGGEIFFLLHGQVVAGTVALIVENGEYEMNDMSIANNYLGLGFSHALMRVAIDWARARGLPGITIVSSTTLVNALSLYKKHGFQVTNLGNHHNYTRCNIALRLSL
jgi:GNAT superfamily N-acetyltransferase